MELLQAIIETFARFLVPEILWQWARPTGVYGMAGCPGQNEI